MHVRFGDFTLNSESHQLRHGDVERHLTPKAFTLLCVLIERRPNAVSKAQLHEHLWPSTFVSEATLTSLVAELRNALKDGAGDSRTTPVLRAQFVKTIHRFGYAFNGVVMDIPPGRPTVGRVSCWVVWESGQVALADGDHLLGRDGDVSVWLESPTVSRRHARIRVQGPQAIVEDLRSKNGTYVRGERIHVPASVLDGDEIRLGSVSMKFRVLTSGGSTVTQRSLSSS